MHYLINVDPISHTRKLKYFNNLLKSTKLAA